MGNLSELNKWFLGTGGLDEPEEVEGIGELLSDLFDLPTERELPHLRLVTRGGIPLAYLTMKDSQSASGVISEPGNVYALEVFKEGIWEQLMIMTWESTFVTTGDIIELSNISMLV